MKIIMPRMKEKLNPNEEGKRILSIKLNNFYYYENLELLLK